MACKGLRSQENIRDLPKYIGEQNNGLVYIDLWFQTKKLSSVWWPFAYVKTLFFHISNPQKPRVSLS